MPDNKKFPDAEIIRNLRSGLLTEEMVRELYREHFEPLTRYVQANKGSREDAEDIFQEVLVAFIGLVKQDKFRQESGIRTFLYSMNRFAWLNELKKRGRALAREVIFEKGNERMDPGAADMLAGREERAQLKEVVSSLGETCRKILLLFYYENRSIREILRETEFENEQVVRNKKYKCLKQLEQLLNGNPNLKKNLKSMLNG